MAVAGHGAHPRAGEAEEGGSGPGLPCMWGPAVSRPPFFLLYFSFIIRLKTLKISRKIWKNKKNAI
jgi:hypothetical protein